MALKIIMSISSLVKATFSMNYRAIHTKH